MKFYVVMEDAFDRSEVTVERDMDDPSDAAYDAIEHNQECNCVLRVQLADGTHCPKCTSCFRFAMPDMGGYPRCKLHGGL